MGIYRRGSINVDQFYPNYFSLYDMDGNVYEICWKTSYPKLEENDNNKQNKYKNTLPYILRGGSWYSFDPRKCHSAFSLTFIRHKSTSSLGFAIVIPI